MDDVLLQEMIGEGLAAQQPLFPVRRIGRTSQLSDAEKLLGIRLPGLDESKSDLYTYMKNTKNPDSLGFYCF